MDVGVVTGEPVENTVYESVMGRSDALPEVKWDVIVMQTDEELVSGDDRESQFDVTEEYDGRVVTVGADMLVGDVRQEGVNGVEGLSV